MPASYRIYSSLAASHRNSRWGQIIDFASAFGVIEVASVGNAQEEGVNEITRINRLYLSSDNLPSVSEVQKTINKDLIASLLLCSIQESSCLLWMIGEGTVLLRRGRILSTVLEQEGVMKGTIKDNDCLIVLSKTAKTVIRLEDRGLFSPALSPKEIADALSIRFAQERESAEGAVALVIELMLPRDEQRVVDQSKQSLRSLISAKIDTIKRFFSFRRIVLIALMMFFVVSVILGVRKQLADTRYRDRRVAIQEAETLFKKGSAIMDLQPMKSQEYFQEALMRISPYSGSALPRGRDGKTILSLEQAIRDHLRIVSKVYPVDPQLFYDASFLQPDRVISLFTVGENALAFADTNVGMIAVVSLISKDATIVAGGEGYKSTRFLSFLGNTLYIVTDTAVETVKAGDRDVQKVLSIEQPFDAFSVYGGNLYGILKDKGVIFRYKGTQSGFDQAESYLAEDVRANLSSARGMSIDGSIWIGSSIGKIFRYTQGRDDSFIVHRIDPPLGNILDVSVHEQHPMVYIFDPDRSRIVLFSKQGAYQAQYVYGNAIQPSSFGVSFSMNRVYLLANQKIYVFNAQ